MGVVAFQGLPQQLPNQEFEVHPRVSHATVGDSIALVFRVRLDPQDLLYDTVPRPLGELPQGLRVLQVAKLRRAPDRTFVGEAELTYFRVGRQPIPMFGLDFMRGVKGMTRATLTSDSAFVTIDSVAPPGNPPLKDIQELPVRGLDGRRVAGALVSLLGSAALVRLLQRRKPRGQSAPLPVRVEAMVAPSAYANALTRLEEIEQAEWARQGGVDRHYAAVADTIRRYLEEAHSLPAPTCTTNELRQLLSGKALLQQDPCLSLLKEADLVKFARATRGADDAADYLRQARAVLAEWHEESSSPACPPPA